MSSFRRVLTVSAILPLLHSAADAQPAASSRSDGVLSDPIACRAADIFGGQNDTGAILTRIRGQTTPLHVFKLGDASESPLRVEMVPSLGSEAIWEVSLPEYLRFYWTSKDDFAVWRGTDIWWVGKDKIKTGASPKLEYKELDNYILPMGPNKDDVVPEHAPVVLIPGVQIGRYVVEFDPQWPVLRYIEKKGPRSVTGLANQDFAWITDRVFGALSFDLRGRGKALEIYEDDQWKLFAPLWLPKDAKLVLFRNNPRDGKPEAVVRWPEKGAGETFGIVRRGALKADILAAGSFERIYLSPDKTRIYGLKDFSGRFVRLKGESHPREVSFWLSKFEAMGGIEKFYFLEKGKYAFVKMAREKGGTGVMILERRGDTVRVAQELCASQPDAASVEVLARSYLFVPKSVIGDKLIVYFNDGPFTRLEKSGDWLIDILSGTGNPVLAIDHVGTSENSRSAAAADPGLTIENVVESQIALAQKRLGTKGQKIVLVGADFGSIPAFAAINSGRLSPVAFIAVSGFVEPRRVLRSNNRDMTPELLARIGMILRQARAADEKSIIERQPGLRVHFIHGRKNERAPYEDAANFVDRFNGLKPASLATLSAIPEMENLPRTRNEYDAVIKLIRAVLS
jgi:hypothetical protein